MSTEPMFTAASNPQLLNAGPLAGDLDGFAAALLAKGYTRASVEQKLRLIKRLGYWLQDEGFGVDVLDEMRFESFLHSGHSSIGWGHRATGQQFLSHLRQTGRISDASAVSGQASPVQRIERAYQRYLLEERGLDPSTVNAYSCVIRAFLVDRFDDGAVSLERLSIRDVNRFILFVADRSSRSYAKYAATVLCGFLRHLYQCGDIPVDLANAVLPVTQWRHSELPKRLPLEQVTEILASCDRDTVAGRRDYAILQLLARLGLRAGEICAMTLDDVDWDNGVLVVSGKRHRREPMPIPEEVGEALVEYLRGGRPRCATRRVFLCLSAPHRGFATSTAICDVVARALARAGIDPPFKGSHLLRHSLATGMLRKGASLEEIGQVLRHRRPDTTAIYAKVDLEGLRAVAMAWSGGES